LPYISPRRSLSQRQPDEPITDEQKERQAKFAATVLDLALGMLLAGGIYVLLWILL